MFLDDATGLVLARNEMPVHRTFHIAAPAMLVLRDAIEDRVEHHARGHTENEIRTHQRTDVEDLAGHLHGAHFLIRRALSFTSSTMTRMMLASVATFDASPTAAVLAVPPSTSTPVS